MLWSAQNTEAQSSKLKFWNLRYLNGAVTLTSDWFRQKFIRQSGYEQTLNSTLWRGLFELQSQSYILHRNFILIDFDASYRPGTRKDEYIVIPKRTVNTTSEKINSSVFIFKEKPFNASFNFGFDHSFTNRDFASNVENYRSTFQSIFNLSNKIIPLRLKYNYENWDQLDLTLNDNYKSIDHTLSLTANKLLFQNFNNYLNINYEYLDRKYSFFQKAAISEEISMDYTSSLNIVDPLNITIASLINYFNRTGFESNNNFQVYENFIFQLPKNFRIITNFSYLNFKYSNLSNKRFGFTHSVSHQLYQSLSSYGKFSFNEADVNTANEKITNGEFGFEYNKIIPFGKLFIAYSYNLESKSNKDVEFSRAFVDERYKLKDGDIVLLQRPNVNVESIIVKSEDGLRVYIEGLDYELIPNGVYIEIRRLLGGAIADGETVIVSYTASIDPNYGYQTKNTNFSAGLSLFSNLIELRYSKNMVSFSNVSNPTALSLRKINRSLYNASINLFGASVGFEYDEFKSNIIPYKSEKSYFEYGYFEEGSLITSLNVNRRIFTYLDSGEKQKFFDLVGKLGIFIGFKSKLNIEGTYRIQEGRGIDLNFATGKIEYQTLYRALYITIGGQFLSQFYLGEKQDYLNGYFKIRRNF